MSHFTKNMGQSSTKSSSRHPPSLSKNLQSLHITPHDVRPRRNIFPVSPYYSNVTSGGIFFRILVGNNLRESVGSPGQMKITNCFLTSRHLLADDGVISDYAFTSTPVPPGEAFVVQITLSEYSPQMNRGNMGIGFTSCDPMSLYKNELPRVDATELIDRPDYWVVEPKAACGFNNGDEFCIKFDALGEIKLSRNGGQFKTLMHVDQSVPLWAFFTLSGTIIGIRLLGKVNIPDFQPVPSAPPLTLLPSEIGPIRPPLSLLPPKIGPIRSLLNLLPPEIGPIRPGPSQTSRDQRPEGSSNRPRPEARVTHHDQQSNIFVGFCRQENVGQGQVNHGDEDLSFRGRGRGRAFHRGLPRGRGQSDSGQISQRRIGDNSLVLEEGHFRGRGQAMRGRKFVPPPPPLPDPSGPGNEEVRGQGRGGSRRGRGPRGGNGFSHSRGQNSRSPVTSDPAPNFSSRHKTVSECIICCDKLVDTVFLPCGHICMCQDCAGNYWQQNLTNKTCPMCRDPSTGFIRTFSS